ncbi:MAG: hypothetical protein ACRDKI_02670 [Solirubrobacterales bacterium]
MSVCTSAARAEEIANRAKKAAKMPQTIEASIAHDALREWLSLFINSSTPSQYLTGLPTLHAAASVGCPLAFFRSIERALTRVIGNIARFL